MIYESVESFEQKFRDRLTKNDDRSLLMAYAMGMIDFYIRESDDPPKKRIAACKNILQAYDNVKRK